MQRPVATPIIIQVDLHSLVLLINALGEKLLNAGILGKRNVGAHVEQEPGFVAEGGGVAAIIAVFVVHHRRDALGMQPVSRTESGHPGSQHDDVWRWHKTTSPKLFVKLFVLRIFHDCPSRSMHTHRLSCALGNQTVENVSSASACHNGRFAIL